jgi:glutamyl-tRNA synthetase
MPIRVRFAPSPTGFLTLGGARTALFAWLFARNAGGSFLLRIEDTDRERSKEEYEKDIRDMLAWLGLTWDEPPVRQTERLDLYEAALERLLAERKAYWCFCSEEELEATYQAQLSQGFSPKYSGKCRSLSESEVTERRKRGDPAVIRFKVPDKVYGFTDLVRGRVEFNAGLIGDIVIAKSLREPLYNFAVVVDDADTKISHVIRGEEHISNTPKQLALYEALGLERPQFAHLPLILGPDRKKLSKRFLTNALKDYRRDGYLPDALINFMVLLGWHPAVDREVVSREEMVQEFSMKRVQKAGAIFNPDKLEWLNAMYLKRLSPEQLAEQLKSFLPPQLFSNDAFLMKALSLVRDRMKKLSDFPKLTAFLFELPEYPPSLLNWKQNTAATTAENLEAVLAVLEKSDAPSFSRSAFESSVMEIATARGRGDVLWPLRVALSGLDASPGPIELLDTLGKEESVRRIRLAIGKLGRSTLLS